MEAFDKKPLKHSFELAFARSLGNLCSQIEPLRLYPFRSNHLIFSNAIRALENEPKWGVRPPKEPGVFRPRASGYLREQTAFRRPGSGRPN